jgi:NitT/TauT family transport system substrate-binding protein
VQTFSRLIWALGSMLAFGTAAPAQMLNVGIVGTTSDAPFFIADKKGYFSDEGLKVNFVQFDTAAKAIPFLGTGEIDIAGGASSAGLYNAAKRGVDIKIVADKQRNPKGYGSQVVLVRKDLLQSGKVKDVRDLKGMKVAVSGSGNSEAAILDEALARVGLKYEDVEPVFLGFAQHAAAFQNGAIDASITAEPSASFILKGGYAVKLVGVDDVAPNFQTAVIFYGGKFIKEKPEAAKGFLRAVMRGMRFYNDALRDGRLAGPNADEVISIMVQYSAIKDPNVFRAIAPHGVDPDGNVNLESLRNAWSFFKRTKQIDGSVAVDDVVDLAFQKAAVESLGPYRREMSAN